jgi:hypothetical protein
LLHKKRNTCRLALVAWLARPFDFHRPSPHLSRHESNGKRCPGAGTRWVAEAPLATGLQQVKDRVKDGAQVGRAWPPTRPACRQVRGDPGPGGVVEIGVVASGAHGSRNRADEPCFARGGSTSQTPSQGSNAAWEITVTAHRRQPARQRISRKIESSLTLRDTSAVLENSL